MRKQTISEPWSQKPQNLKNDITQLFALGLSKNNFEGTTLIGLKPAIEDFN